MRRLLFVLGLLCIATIMSAQRTYYYKYVKTIDKDGVVSNGDYKGRFYTFTNNAMYESDENGAIFKSRLFSFSSSETVATVYYYRGEVNGSLWFCARCKEYVMGNFPNPGRTIETWNEGKYILVSKDYATINDVYDGKKARMDNGLKIGTSDVLRTNVYIRSNPPQAGDDIPGLIR